MDLTQTVFSMEPGGCIWWRVDLVFSMLYVTRMVESGPWLYVTRVVESGPWLYVTRVVESGPYSDCI